MTTMIPTHCVDSCPIARLLHKSLFAQLKSTDRVVECLLKPFKKLTGSLFWVQHEQQSLFVYLANSVESNIDTSNVKQDGLSKLLANNEVSALLELQQELLPEKLHSHRSKLTPLLVINPYVNNENHHNLAVKAHGLYFFGKDLIQSNKLGMIVSKLLGISGSKQLQHYMRGVFSSEVVLGAKRNKSRPVTRNILLDSEQELVMKADVVLGEQNRRVANYNLIGVNGDFSSGKTEVLIQRAKLIRQLSPESRIIVITPDCASQDALKTRFNSIKSDADYLEISSFDEWCKQQLRPSEYLIDEIELHKIISSQLKNQLSQNEISDSIFLRELNYIYGRKIFYENDYVQTKNYTRPYQLSEKQLGDIWKAVLTLKNELSLRKWLLPLSFPQLLFDQYDTQPSKDFYDHILLDDAHYLPPIAFELFKEVIKPETGQLFIAQNPRLDIINSCKLWKDTSLDLRGHSTRLQNVYNINPAIINASHAFSLNRLPNDQTLDFLPNEELIANLLPKLLHFNSEKDEENRLLNEVNRKVHSGTKLEDILIITNNADEIEHLVRLIGNTLNIPVDVLDDRFYKHHKKRNGVGICTLAHAQGVTAHYVYVFGLEKLFGTETQIDSGTSQCQIKIIENTHLLSIVMTRAKKELTLFISSEEIPSAFISPYINIPTAKNHKKKETSNVSYLHKTH